MGVELVGAVAVVTGAGRGIGRSHALRLAEHGAKVVVNDLGAEVDGTGADTSVAQEVVDEIRAAGGTAMVSSTSVATAKGAESVVATAVEAFGTVDVIVSNAGFVSRTTFPEADASEMDRHLALDPLGGFNLSRAAWPYMIRSGHGRIVLTLSAAMFGSEHGISYGTGKSANVGLLRALALQGKPHGIVANAVSPLAFTRLATAKASFSAEEIERRSREAQADDVAALATYLASRECTTTGGMYAVGAGRISRIVWAESAGWNGGELSPESIRDHWDTINSDGHLTVAGTMDEHVSSFYAAARAGHRPSP